VKRGRALAAGRGRGWGAGGTVGGDGPRRQAWCGRVRATAVPREGAYSIITLASLEWASL
jgi:hypothetical protein